MNQFPKSFTFCPHAPVAEHALLSYVEYKKLPIATPLVPKSVSSRRNLCFVFKLVAIVPKISGLIVLCWNSFLKSNFLVLIVTVAVDATSSSDLTYISEIPWIPSIAFGYLFTTQQAEQRRECLEEENHQKRCFIYFYFYSTMET